MSILKIRKGLEPQNVLDAHGLMYQDLQAVTPCQRQCMTKLGKTIQMEQEAYMHQHPEVLIMLKLFISEMVKVGKRKDEILKRAGQYFSRPVSELAKEIEEYKNVQKQSGAAYDVLSSDKRERQYHHDKYSDLEQDLFSTIVEHYPPPPWDVPDSLPTPTETASSSFVSILTSESTLPTPEYIPPAEPTVYETLYGHLSNIVDKAVYLHVDDEELLYDTAYIGLMSAVENAMEEQVRDIKEDIALVFYNAYRLFELIIMEKERLAADIAWQNRQRKKIKRTLRRAENFKGWATPPSSWPDSRDEFPKTFEVPCACHPRFHYNRYSKDRFGIYLPRQQKFSRRTVTLSPMASKDDLDTRSICSRKSEISDKPFHGRKSRGSTGTSIRTGSGRTTPSGSSSKKSHY